MSRTTSVVRRRSRAPEPRTKRVNLACSDAEHEILRRAAESAGISVASYAAKAALAVATHDIAPLPASDTDLLQRFQHADTALNRIGSNLNQIARALNRDQEVAQQQLAAVLRRVAEAARALMEAGAGIARSRVQR
ncbi:plasmid mobilization relaxosome protein MobC [Streptomyces sp. MJP52]|uniref:plasmid mobilization protein n=1 Tax=Streptomyces sp. MJP52 TaxID=2940555 RepID=UPI002474F481|nr:plasmid mobilization relaxosome protein MobC [Streptomyces sp. MJP52]MDH6228951.1 uncharacterized protein (DUF1778 family) [Streptomyces sp. MJP52]